MCANILGVEIDRPSVRCPPHCHCRVLTVLPSSIELHRRCTSLLLAAAMDHSSDDDDCFSVQLNGTDRYPKAPKVITYTTSESLSMCVLTRILTRQFSGRGSQ